MHKTLYHLRHMLFYSEALCQEIEKRLQEGECFSDLAANYSACESRHQKGDIGKLLATELPEELQKCLNDLKHGEWSKNCQTDQGYHLLQLLNTCILSAECLAPEEDHTSATDQRP